MMAAGPQETAALPVAVLDRLMPMHLLVSATGHVRHVGPTLAKLTGADTLIGRRFLECFEMRRPRGVTGIRELAAPGGTKLALRLRDTHRTDLKGLALPLPGEAGLIVNLAFGISAVEAVGTYRLTSGDFPPTDLTVEMLYLVEAQEAVLDESRSLNQRLQGAKIAAEEQAFTDTLTGVKNRRAMDHILARHVEAQDAFAVMHIDLDWFKEVNDTHGHAAGDHVLQVAARTLVDETRDDDTVSRAGGDEFVLIFPRLTDRARLAGIARRILKRLETPMSYQGAQCRISASIGIATFEGGSARDAAGLLEAADEALYRSKDAGRGRFSFAVQARHRRRADDPCAAPKAAQSDTDISADVETADKTGSPAGTSVPAAKPPNPAERPAP